MRGSGKATGLLVGGLFLAGALVLGGSKSAEARPLYLKGFVTEYPKLEQQVLKTTKCDVCHFGKPKKNRNNYGATLADIFEDGFGGAKNVKDMKKIQEALKKAAEKESAVKDKTFGDLIKEEKLPATGWEAPKVAAK